MINAELSENERWSWSLPHLHERAEPVLPIRDVRPTTSDEFAAAGEASVGFGRIELPNLSLDLV